jgi:hypothetical protein
MLQHVALALCAFLTSLSCSDEGVPRPVTSSEPISTDGQLFALVSEAQPFASYTIFPKADSITSGTLNGSNAHQPSVRVSLDATAYNALHDGTLPAGGSFPNGSIIFKQIIMDGQTVLYAIQYKDSSNTLAGSYRLWAEYRPDGAVTFSISNRGNGCISCHMREQGPQHDLIRTFERQR